MSAIEVDPDALLAAAGRCAAVVGTAVAVRRLLLGGAPDTGRPDDRALVEAVLTDAERALRALTTAVDADAVRLRAAAALYTGVDAVAVPRP